MANVRSPRLMPMHISITCAGDDVAGEKPPVISSAMLMTGVLLILYSLTDLPEPNCGCFFLRIYSYRAYYYRNNNVKHCNDRITL
jgi:hypothetical protein